MNAEPLGGNCFRVRFSAPTVQKALNLTLIYCIMQVLFDDSLYVSMKEADMLKYITCINELDAPYFVRYMFSSRAINNAKSFAVVKEALERPGLQLKYGDTRQQRYDAIKRSLTGGEMLVDIGCSGEVFYPTRMARDYLNIVAIDADPDEVRLGQGRINHKRMTEQISMQEAYVNAEWVNEHADLFDNADVLMTEVIEHIPLAEALATIEAILKTNFRRFVVTTPNKDFNKHYLIPDDEMRHADHKWEEGENLFTERMFLLARQNHVDTAIIGVGDTIDDVPTSLLAEFINHKCKAEE